MTGSGADGGVGKSPAKSPEKSPENSPEKLESVSLEVDFYSQAYKALSERSPFDSAEFLANTSPTLPSVLASLVSKHSDSRKKHKRHHSDDKSSRKSSEKSKKANIWVELEGYFRELALDDLEKLCRFSRLFSLVSSVNSCLTIPVIGNAVIYDDDNISKTVENDSADVLVENVVEKTNEETENEGIVVSRGAEFNGNDVDKESNKQQVSIEDSARVSSTQSCSSSVEWVLGSRNRVLLATTRPSKKRKLLGENAVLERLMVAQPCEGSSSLCHVCSIGDTGDQLNQLVVCKSCKVVVHQKCYGVQGEVNEAWVCSFCKHGCGSSYDRPCVLCPKSGGALKRFQRDGDGESSAEFAHLFCCQWMPEVHIDDTRMMEPLLSVDRVKDVRGKLICNLCEIKLGSCVRCSDGSCRNSFHPICAREARNKLEIWGKFGCDDIELRGFCGKHSVDSNVVGNGTMEKKESGDSFGGDLLSTSVQQGNKIKKLKISCRNGDKVTPDTGAANGNTKSSEEQVSQEVIPNNIKSNTELYSGSGDLPGLCEMKPPGQKLTLNKTQHFDLGAVLKKLLDRGKVSLEQIASEISITEDSLATKLAGNHLGPDISCKILKWLRGHAYMDTSEKDSRAKVRRLSPPKDELVSDDHSDGVALADLDLPDAVPVKSVPSRRRTVGKIVKDENIIPISNDKLLENDDSIKEEKEQGQGNGDHDHYSNKIMVESNIFEHPLEESLRTSESSFLKSTTPCDVQSNVAEERTLRGKHFMLDMKQEPPSTNTAGCCDGRDFESMANTYVHPYIEKKLEEVQSLLVKNEPPESYAVSGLTEMESCAEDLSATVIDNVREDKPNYDANLGNLHVAKEMGILDLSPESELEGEIILSQQCLLCNTVALKHCADQLVSKVVRSLPNEMDAVRKQRWDDVLVKQYTSELKEARKQSRKERKHKEAQAVLAAATAAVASSSRVSSLRKDTADESSQPENPLKMEISRIRGGLSSPPVPRPKELNSSFDVPRATSDGYPDKFQYSSGSPNEHLKSCDICTRTESLLNPILVCLGCKVAVHLNCYRSVKESTGPWYCELCEESFSSKASRSTSAKPSPIAECGLCGASNGAFRKSTNGQWIHAICAEWVFDSTFRRGQTSLVAGMESVLKGNDVCSVCHRKFGVCLKCNYGNCQVTFHPSCARSAGSYMYTKYIGGGKMHHKAYCSKHSSEQKVKTETLKHGVEDLKVVKQHRVELEKLRLLCERIVKREKLKRELALCNYGILASRLDALPLSMPVRRPVLPYDGSSESATTTSLKGHSRSCSEAMQKSDDVTADSALSSKRCPRLPLSVDNVQKAEDSSTSKHVSTPKPTERIRFAGKQLPVRAAMPRRNVSHSGEKTVKSRKNSGTVEKEILMTVEQASSQNLRLPKGYFYVPRDSLSDEKQDDGDSAEKEDTDE